VTYADEEIGTVSMTKKPPTIVGTLFAPSEQIGPGILKVLGKNFELRQTWLDVERNSFRTSDFWMGQGSSCMNHAAQDEFYRDLLLSLAGYFSKYDDAKLVEKFRDVAMTAQAQPDACGDMIGGAYGTPAVVTFTSRGLPLPAVKVSIVVDHRANAY
jgi:hypothetical protein